MSCRLNLSNLVDVCVSVTGLKLEWQVNDIADARDSSELIEKLGSRGMVKELEGKTL